MVADIPVCADQEAVVAALACGAAVGESQPLRRIDTHMSHVFLARDRVYKLKRAVDHPFVDLSSLAARRTACEAELSVNQALAPDLYLGLQPVVRGPGGDLRIGGPGEAVDWVVVMRRFPDRALFDEIAADGALTADRLIEAADAVSRFHAQSPPRIDMGRAADYRRIIEGLRRTEAAGAAALGMSPGSASLFDSLDRDLARHAPLIEARREAGWTRRGHGDLHLRNICLFDDRVMLFDALEFDPALATTDVIYDIAFLLMDLRARGLDDLANVTMNRYWDAARQPEAALALLPLFMALRAAVRMAISVEAGDLDQAGRYRRLGLDILGAGPPLLVAVGGLSGTGKSTLAKAVAAALPGPCGARILRSDVIRKALAGAAAGEALPPDAYTAAARARIYRAMAGRAEAALRSGASVIADATFREPSARGDIEPAAGEHRFQGLWLRAAAPVRAQRIGARVGDESDITAAGALDQAEPGDPGAQWRIVDADRPITDLAAEVEAAVSHAGKAAHRAS